MSNCSTTNCSFHLVFLWYFFNQTWDANGRAIFYHLQKWDLPLQRDYTLGVMESMQPLTPLHEIIWDDWLTDWLLNGSYVLFMTIKYALDSHFSIISHTNVFATLTIDSRKAVLILEQISHFNGLVSLRAHHFHTWLTKQKHTNKLQNKYFIHPSRKKEKRRKVEVDSCLFFSCCFFSFFNVPKRYIPGGEAILCHVMGRFRMRTWFKALVLYLLYERDHFMINCILA